MIYTHCTTVVHVHRAYQSARRGTLRNSLHPWREPYIGVLTDLYVQLTDRLKVTLTSVRYKHICYQYVTSNCALKMCTKASVKASFFERKPRPQVSALSALSQERIISSKTEGRRGVPQESGACGPRLGKECFFYSEGVSH